MQRIKNMVIVDQLPGDVIGRVGGGRLFVQVVSIKMGGEQGLLRNELPADVILPRVGLPPDADPQAGADGWPPSLLFS